MATNLLAGLEGITSQLTNTESELSSGLRIQKPSDDPFGTSQALLFQSELASNGWWKIFSKPSLATWSNYDAMFHNHGLLTASRAQKIESVSGLINLVMMPMWIFSGVFFSYERFPAVIHPLIKALPLTALNDALRASILEGTPILHQWPRLLVMILWGGISFVLALKWFRWT